MSRRKQYRPKLVKDEMDANGEPRSKRSAIKEEPIEAEDIQCQLCEQRFVSISDLQTHTIASHAQPPQPATPCLECQQCDAVLPSFAAFVVHMRTHLKSAGDRPRQPAAATHFACSQCPIQFNNIQARQHHLLTHFESSLTRIQCTDCAFVGLNPNSMVQHYTEKHLKTQHLCQICAEVFESIKEFKDHCASHWMNTIYYECVACRVPFESRELLSIHVQLVHDREESRSEGAEPSVIRNMQAASMEREKMLRVVHCSVCDVKCIGEEALDEHRLFSHCKVIQSDVCAECLEPIQTADDFKKHTRLHIRDMYMNCAVCRQSLRNESQLQLHAQFHMEKTKTKKEEVGDDEQMDIIIKAIPSSSQAIFTMLEEREQKDCPFCRQTFKSTNNMIKHVEKGHPQEQVPFKCDLCIQHFYCRAQFETHITTVHDPSMQRTNEQDENNSFQCGICQEIFESSTALFSHLQSSKNCSPSFRCPICALSLNTVSRFESHLKRHNNASPCTCQICGIAFLRKEELDEHMYHHKGNLELNRTLA